MRVISTKIKDVLIVEPKIFGDERGFFMESYNEIRYQEVGIKYVFVQDNHSCSQKDVLRGLHYQVPPHAQGKLVQVIQGSVLDVVVDIRFGSPTFGQYIMVELNDKNKRQLWVPPGFAHGFITLCNDTFFHYKCTDFYFSDHERGILWNDYDSNIDWKVKNPIVSEKDAKNGQFKDMEKDFIYTNI